LLGRAVPAVVTALLRLMRHRAAAIAAYKCIAVMDLQTLARSKPVLREIQFQQCSFYSRRLLEAAVVNVVSAWK
jgi:hypothetical protein